MKHIIIDVEKDLELESRILNTIEKIRPFLRREGGDMNYIGYDDGIVYIQMLGACIDCGFLDSTLNDGIAVIILEEIPEVVDVKLATPEILEKFGKIEE